MESIHKQSTEVRALKQGQKRNHFSILGDAENQIQALGRGAPPVWTAGIGGLVSRVLLQEQSVMGEVTASQSLGPRAEAQDPRGQLCTDLSALFLTISESTNTEERCPLNRGEPCLLG